MSNDGRERETIKFGDVKLVDNTMTVPELPKREKGEHWAKRRPMCDLVENDRIMIGFNEGSTLRARVKAVWRSEQKGANYGPYVVSLTYADNDDSYFDGCDSSEWADEVYPLLAQIIVGYGSDAHAFMTFQDWDRAALYVEKHNQRAADSVALEMEGLRSHPDNDQTAEDMEEYRNTLIMDQEAHLRPVMMVPEWAVQPSVEV